jgi:hypothetical protein
MLLIILFGQPQSITVTVGQKLIFRFVDAVKRPKAVDYIFIKYYQIFLTLIPGQASPPRPPSGRVRE